MLHFTIDELCRSDIATRHGWDNTPRWAAFYNLHRLIGALEDVRAALGDKPILISSGYRCPELNRIVGGAANSAHTDGRAADFICPDFGSPRAVCAALARAKLPFDQLIWEGSWVHYAIARQDAAPRSETLNAHFANGRASYGKADPKEWA